MTLLTTLYILLISAIGAHSQRTLGDVEYELHQDMTKAEIELSQYYKDFNSQNEELQAQIRNCNQIRIKFYSCDYDRMFDMTYILHDIQYEYLLLTNRSTTDSEKESLYKRKIRRLYFQLEGLRRLNPALPEIDVIPDSIREASSDSLLYLIYSDAGSSRDVISNWVRMDSTAIRQRNNCIRYGLRLIAIYKTHLRYDSIMCHRYSILRRDFQKTYDDALASFKLLQHDIIFKHNTPYISTIRNAKQIFENTVKQEIERYREWDKHNNGGFIGSWVLILIAVIGFLLALLIVYAISYFTRNKPNTLVRFKRNKRLWIWTITNLIWFILIELSMTLAPSNFIMAGGVTVTVFLVFLLAIRLSNIVVGSAEYPYETLRMYNPVTAMAFLLMMFRLFFVPDQLLAMLLFPFSVGLLVWQMVCLSKYWAKINRLDSITGLITSIVLLVMAVTSFFGYIYMALGLFYWWQCQVMMLSGIAILVSLLKKYYNTLIVKRIKNYYESLNCEYDIREDRPIQITWIYDWLKMVAVPLLIINSLPICVYLALSFFNAGNSFEEIFYKTFFSLAADDGKVHVVLSLYNIVVLTSMFFNFRFFRHLFVSIYRQIKKDVVMRKSGNDHFNNTNVNYTLGTNTISLVVWACFVIAVCLRLKIPMQSLTFIFAGLATGIGFALKDILNNLFYGMQLMAGRLKVGDYVICDNYRGAVKSISYQTTQILTEEGALVCFSNSELFSKNFQNLTSHNPYEVNWVKFYVPYGCDLQHVESIARKATERLNTTDKFGRPLLSPDEGIVIEFSEMGASSLEMAVRVGVIAQERTLFLPVLRKAIYTELTDNNISIPFNQLDLHIVKDAEGNGLTINNA